MDVDFSEYFKAPSSYNPPLDADLNGSTEFPNLNSIEYRGRQGSSDIVLLPFYEVLEANEDQSTLLLATNSYNQRLWNGTVFGYEHFADIGKPNVETIKLSFDSNITGIRFVDKMMVLFTTASGSIQLWSTQSKVRQSNGYNLFQVSKKTEHYGMVTSFTTLGNNGVVTASTDGCLKVWKIDPCDIVSEKTFRHAHKDSITDISVKPNSDQVFATTSRDRHISIWDLRSNKPLENSGINKDFANTACLWTQNQSADNLYVGDDTGAVYIYDPRKLDEFLVSQQLFDRPIHKFKPSSNGQYICVLGQTNAIKVLNVTSGAETIYNNSNATDYVRDVCWVKDKQTFHTVGWNMHVGRHTVNP